MSLAEMAVLLNGTDFFLVSGLLSIANQRYERETYNATALTKATGQNFLQI